MDPIKLITDRFETPSNPSGPAKVGGHSQTKNAAPDIENLYKIDAAMAISHAELGNIIISCREVLDEQRTVDMSDKQKQVFEETVKLIDSAPDDVSVGRLSQLDTETPTRGDQEPPIDHAYRLLGAYPIEEIIQNSQRYLKLRQELSGLRTWWATAITKYKTELNKCSKASIEIDQRLKEIAVLEKAAGSIRTESEMAAEAETRALIRRVKRMKTDLYNTLENFTATRKNMSSARIQFKAIRDTMRRLEGGIKEPPPFDASERPIDFNYDYHLPKKRAADTQWWISKGFSWWANLAYSHLVQTSENLEEAIHMRQSRQDHLQDEVSRLVRQLDEITEQRSECAKFVHTLEREKKVSYDIKLRNKYFQVKRDIATVDDLLTEVKGRLSAYELNLVNLRFSGFIHKLMISMHTAARNILGHALADQQLQTGMYNELSLEYVHAIVCFARKNMRTAVDIMTDVDSGILIKEDMDYLEGVSHQQGDDQKDREKRKGLRKLHHAGIEFVTVQQRNDLLEDAFEASLDENQKVLWLAKVTNGLRNDRKSALDKERLRESTPSPKTKEMANEILRTGGGLGTVDLSTNSARSRSPRKRKEGSLLMEMAQALADFFRSPDISHLFRPDDWIFELRDLFRLVERALQDPPTEDEFMYFVQYCNDVEELFETNSDTQEVRKQKVGWELIDEAPIAGPKRVEPIWGAPAGFEQATDFMIANGPDIHSDTDRDIFIEALRAKWNYLAAVQVSRDKFQSYVDAWHDSGKFIVILRLESDGLLLRFIDNGWQHLHDFPGVILPYPPLENLPYFWREVWRLIMEPQVASIWRPRVQSGQVRTVMDFYVEVRDAMEKASGAAGSGFWELWVPTFMKGRKVRLTLYKFWLFLRVMANVPGQRPIIVLDRKGQQIHDNRLGSDEVTSRLSTQLGL